MQTQRQHLDTGLLGTEGALETLTLQTAKHFRDLSEGDLGVEEVRSLPGALPSGLCQACPNSSPSVALLNISFMLGFIARFFFQEMICTTL